MIECKVEKMSHGHYLTNMKYEGPMTQIAEEVCSIIQSIFESISQDDEFAADWFRKVVTLVVTNPGSGIWEKHEVIDHGKA